MSSPVTNGAGLLGPLAERWNQLARRERALLGGALAVLAVVLLWQLVLSPSLRTLNGASLQAAALEAKLQQMQSLQMQATALQKQAPLAYDDALRALTQATKQTLGSSAQLSVVAQRANVNLQAASADALAQWLAQVRVNARSIPLEARLTRMATPAGVTWSGALVMSLPQR